MSFINSGKTLAGRIAIITQQHDCGHSSSIEVSIALKLNAAY